MKIAVFGAGHLGKIHIKCLKEAKYWQFAGFFDPDGSNAEKAIRDFGAHQFASPEELIDSVDAVDIVTPTPSHFELAKKALKSGKHVFIEKPVTHTIAEGKKLLAMAEKTGLKVQVGHVERFNPAFLAIKNTPMNPMFIHCDRLAAFQPRGTEVSVVLDLMIHDIDMVLHLVKSKVKKVSASGVAVMSNTPDIANARIEFENGCVADLTASRISMKKMRKMRFFQPDTYISLDFLEKQAQLIRLFAQDAEQLPPMDDLMEFDTPAGKKWLHMQMPETSPGNAIQMELESFAESIVNDSLPVVSLQDGFDALVVAHKVLTEIEKRIAKYAAAT